MDSDSPTALYLHIPFCDSLCPYCDFTKVITGTFSSQHYLERLIEEIESYRIEDHSLETIYIGGGTPSALTEEELDFLLSYLYKRFFPVKEFTIEANPESLSLNKVRLLSQYGVNRVSLGVQSVNNDILQALHRKHSLSDVKNVILDLKQNNIKNINLDFIYGLPLMNEKDLDDDIDFALSQNITHLSFYSLQIEKGTQFYANHLEPVSDEILSSQYQRVVNRLSKHGFHRYEVSNFSLPGYESLHNLTYWKDLRYYAAGVSASGYLDHRRYVNTKSIAHYLKGDNRKEWDILTKEDEEIEFLMLSLRLEEGFLITDFKSRFQVSFLDKYQKQIQKHKDAFLIDNVRFKLKPENIYIMDYYLLELIS